MINQEITYDTSCDSMYIHKATPQGVVGTVLLYSDDKDNTMVALDTDEVGTIVGIELVGVKRLMQKFSEDNIINNN